MEIHDYLVPDFKINLLIADQTKNSNYEILF